MSIELYIKNRLCDINSPESLGIRLKRQFINPAELSVKDAQMSYEITLPATPNNNEIFSHVNVEEVQGKFRIYEDARLYVDGILILDGKFRLSEITQDSYKGNLGVPAPLTAKDIFGETIMNQAGKWLIPFTGVDDITRYNTGGHDKSVYGEISPCIFPLVLYGLLPKYPSNNIYSTKDVFDKSVRLKLDHFPPSVNCIHMLKKIFSNAGYSLIGSAVDDERIKNLYVSYKNNNDYELPWPPSKMEISGNWKPVIGLEAWPIREIGLGHQIFDGRQRIVINYFGASNHRVTAISDNGKNITKEGMQRILRIPATGLYKLTFKAKLEMLDQEHNDLLVRVKRGNLDTVHTEIKLIRNYKADAETTKFDNTFYYNNRNQTVGMPDAVFPRKGEVNFIDPKQNKDFIAGFAFGKYGEDTYINPLDNDHCNPMAIFGGPSWTVPLGSDGVTERAYSAVKSSGYVYFNQEEPNSYKVDLNKETYAKKTSNKSAYGEINQVIWLEKGETLDIIDISFSEGKGIPFTIYNHSVDYSLSLEPFQHSIKWLKMRNNGSSSDSMDWNDESSFNKEEINLIKFLPAEMKVNDWVDNFCKAFNLRLINTGETNFELKIKGSDIVNDLSDIIDLDKRTNVVQRRNESLKLPYLYELGFTVDTGEEGYYDTIEEYVIDEKGYEQKKIDAGDKGGGQYYTGSNETTKLSQTSSFSYNWHKGLRQDEVDKEPFITVPIIADHEVWENKYDYAEMMGNKYYEKAQRFWYKSGSVNLMINDNDKVAIDIALVDNIYKGSLHRLMLNYKNEHDSIMKSFFLLLTNNDNSYTIVDCYLTAEEYSRLNKSLVKLNGDLYHIAEVDGYDPLKKGQGTMKLIRKIG